MASGKTHETASLTLIGTGAVVAYILQHPAAWHAVGGLVVALLVTPDIDIDIKTREERRWRYVPVIGPLLNLLFWLFWLPYGKMFAHRGLSHAPFLGTFTRIAYMALISIFMASMLDYITHAEITESTRLFLSQQAIRENGLALMYGWALQDNVHLLLDAKKAWQLAGMIVVIVLMIVWGINYAL